MEQMEQTKQVKQVNDEQIELPRQAMWVSQAMAVDPWHYLSRCSWRWRPLLQCMLRGPDAECLGLLSPETWDLLRSD